MTLQNLNKILDSYEQELGYSANTERFEVFKGLPFYNWDNPNDTKTFNHRIGLPLKEGKRYRLFDYEETIYNALQTHKHIWIKKATGLGVTEFILRYMIWLCLKDNTYRNAQMPIICGPNIDIAIKLIKRIRAMFEPIGIFFDSKETTVIINGCTIEAYPSNHLDAYRSLERPKFIFLDEADFFRIGEQQDARNVSERYIAKSNPYIVMVSTPNAPDGLFESIEKEPESTCIYHRLKLDYKYGLGKIYTESEIEQAKRSPSFEREYNLKYLGLIGNVFSTKDIEAAIVRAHSLDELEARYSSKYENYRREQTQKSMGIDPGFGSSAFGIVITEWINHHINVIYADEFDRADFNQMINKTLGLCQKYGINKQNSSQIFVDGSNPAFIRSLKAQLGEREDYEAEIEFYKHNSKGYDWASDMLVVPVSFGNKHKAMLSHTKKLMEDNGGIVCISPRFEKLITSLRTATAKEYTLDKEATSYDDIFDAFRLALTFYQ